MSKFGTNDEGGLVKFKGYMLVGPPFEVRQEFYQPEGEWAQGRWSSVIAGKIHAPLEYPVYTYDRSEKFIAPDDCVGHQVAFFCHHPLKNHVVGDGYDDYRYLATRWDQWGRPWPDYTTEMVLSKVGAGTRGLNTKDDEELMTQIIALLNTGKPFPVAVWDSRMGDIELQIPAGTEVLAQFHKFLYWDWRPGKERPTWLAYEAQGDSGLYTVRDVTFLLRVVAPDPWTGTLLRLPVNYTIRRGEDDEGNPMWTQHEMAQFSDVMKTFDVKAEDFATSVDESLLMEVEVGEPANWLGPLELALQEAAKRRLVYITVPKRTLKFKHVRVADSLIADRITGQESFIPPVLRSIRDLSKEEIEAATQGEEEKIPGFEIPPEMTKSEAMAEIHRVVGRQVWPNPHTRPTGEGLEFAKTYLAPAFEVLGRESTGLDGWTAEKLKDLEVLMGDETFRAACETTKDAAVEFGINLLKNREETPADGTAF